VANKPSFSERKTRWMNRFVARRSARARPATGFVSQPEPRTIGSFNRGRQLISGNILLAGSLIEAPDTLLWDITPPNDEFQDVMHGFGWFDDLAAVGDAKARAVGQAWIDGWIEQFGKGRGPGWTPDLTGRRLIRWIHHALFILRGREGDQSFPFYQSLAQQTIFLSKRWPYASPGLPRFEALTGLLYAGLSLQGMEQHVDPAAKALARECERQIDKAGGIPTRNPEELLEVFTLLTWAAAALAEMGHMPEGAHVDAIERIAPTLRSLRHSDGSLARFHGGGRGLEGRLDQALASSGVKSELSDAIVMGYARMTGGRTSVVVDVAAPPENDASRYAHASTLAFELTSGRRPLIVSSGAGEAFGPDWSKAGRATQSHSTVVVDGTSSSRMNQDNLLFTQRPASVTMERVSKPASTALDLAHDGYRTTHGLTHVRQIELSGDGRQLSVSEMLTTLTEADKKIFDRRFDDSALSGVPFSVRLHLHPDVDATIDMGGSAVSLVLKSGEIWVLRHKSKASLKLEPSVYLEKGRLQPRATTQIVLEGRVMPHAAQVQWSLAKAQDTPNSIRDLERDDPVLPI